MAVRGSRLQKSVYTYGLAGRVLWTLASVTVLYLLLAPLVRLLRAGLINAGTGAIAPLFLGVAGVILMVWLWPRFIRDVWQPASVAGDELTDRGDHSRRELESLTHAGTETEAEPLSQRSAPTRW
jgi:Zn-dependent protease with chaperone function